MRGVLVLFWFLTCGLGQGQGPADLNSAFLKTVIYQKRIGGYEAGPEERKQVTQGVKKGDLYEFQKEDGTLFLVSPSEVLGVLPVFPSLQTPCEKQEVEGAIHFLEKAQKVLPTQPEVSAAALEKWKSLVLVFDEIDNEWRVPAPGLAPDLRNLFLAWAYGLPGLSLLALVSGLILLLRRRMGFAWLLIFTGLGGGLLWGASLQPPPSAQAPSTSSSPSELFRQVFWAISCGKKAGLVQEITHFRVPADDWLNFLFHRIHFSDKPAGLFAARLTKPFFQKHEEGVLMRQPVQVGPLAFPLAFEFFPLEEKESPEQLVVKKVWIGRVPWPTRLDEKWVGKLFEDYRPLWNKIQDEGTIQWKMGPRIELEILITPKAT